MSSRARRVRPSVVAERFAWGGAVAEEPAVFAPEPVAAAVPERVVDPAAVERDAFAKGYQQGERAGTEAGAARAEAMLRRLAQTLDELRGLRKDLVRRTEREVVELALAIAKKILQRELALDGDLVWAMARVALDRLADVTTASIRLHPDDYAAAMAGRGAAMTSHGVQVVADPTVGRGGCIVQSDAGAVDVGLTAQIDELTEALLGDSRHPAGLEQRRDDAA
ncbi:MAG: FliH/SctL family protein [Vicinamibacterales bacterium]